MTTKRVIVEHNDHTITEIFSVMPDGAESLISKTFQDGERCCTETYSNGVKIRVNTLYETPSGAVVDQSRYDIATKGYVADTINALSFDNVIESDEVSLADYVTTHGTDVTEGTILVLVNADVHARRFIRRDHTVSNDGTEADFINISDETLASGSVTSDKLDADVLNAIGDAVGKVLQIDGDGTVTDFVLTHNLGTKDIIVCVRNLADDELVSPAVYASTVDTVTVSFAAPPTVDTHYRVVINRVKYGVM